MNQYLAASEFIDFDHQLVARKAQELADGASDQHDLIKRCCNYSARQAEILKKSS